MEVGTNILNINVQMSNLENTSMDAKLDNLQIVTFLECIISFFQRGEARIEFRIVIFPRISLEKMPDSAPRQCQRGANKDGCSTQDQDQDTRCRTLNTQSKKLHWSLPLGLILYKSRSSKSGHGHDEMKK